MIVHNDKIAGNVKETGGGGGLTCNPLFPGGPPPYADYNGDKIGGSVTVSGLKAPAGMAFSAIPSEAA